MLGRLVPVLRQATRGVMAVRQAPLAARTLSQARPSFDRLRLLDMIEQEIQDEQTNGVAAEIPAVYGDFQISHVAGTPQVKLTANKDGDKVTVLLNINECPMEEASEGDEDSESVPAPHFSVEIENGKSLTMVMDCSIESSGDLVITRAGFHNKGVSAADRYDKVYMNEVDFLSDELYTSMIEYLDEKGIDGDMYSFIEGLVADKEYSEYLKWLNDAKSFLSR